MAIDRNRLEDLLKQLPDELQEEVLEFAESLLQRNHEHELSAGGENNSPTVRSLFGVWDSGDPRSADNDRIDTDLAREYAGSHKADS